MKESREFIVSGVETFLKKHQLAWPDVSVIVAGDILTALSNHKLLYSTETWDYALYRPADYEAAAEIADELGRLGAKVFKERKFGDRAFLAVYSEKSVISSAPLPDILESAPWKSPLVNRRVIDSAAAPGEFSPFTFKGENYRTESVLAHYVHPGTPVGYRPHENYFCIRRESDDRMISIPLFDHYFASAYVWNDRCYCYSMNQENGCKLDVVWSDDLISWSPIHCVFDYSDRKEGFCNTSVTFDGKKFILLYETDDPAYPIYTFHFAESDDLVNWKTIPGAVYASDKYTGGGCLHWVEEDKLFYLSTLDLFIHPTARKVCYRFIVSRSPDLIHWEDAPDDRPLLLPDCTHRPDPVNHPDVYEISVSDVEYRVTEGKVTVYYIGGNQWGVCDNQIAEYHGTLGEMFREFFK